MLNANSFIIRAMVLHPEFPSMVHSVMNQVRGRACPAPSVMSPERRAEFDRLLTQLQNRDAATSGRLAPLLKFLAGYTPEPGDAAFIQRLEELKTYAAISKPDGTHGIIVGIESGNDFYLLGKDGMVRGCSVPGNNNDFAAQRFRFLEESEVTALIEDIKRTVIA